MLPARATVRALLSSVVVYAALGVGMPAQAEQYKEVVSAVRQVDAKLLTPLSSEVQQCIKDIADFREATYLQLRRRYQRFAKRAATEFPETIASADLGVLGKFWGTKQLEDPEVYACPLLLISPYNFEAEGSVLLKQDIEVGTVRLPLLVFRSAAAKEAHQSRASRMLEPSLRTVNARVMGFRYAQLIMPLSKNAAPAAKFNYNGLRNWSQHNRLAQEDQINKPIALSNHAHSSDSRYLISTHPDFALELQSFLTEEVHMTFFLWREKPSAIPDLVYRIEYLPPF